VQNPFPSEPGSNTGTSFKVDGPYIPGTKTQIGSYFSPIWNLANSNTSGAAAFNQPDGHTGTATGGDVLSANGGVTYAPLIKKTATFEDVFTVVDPKKLGPANHIVIYTYDWSYTWDNRSYQYSPLAGQGYRVGTTTCASTAANGGLGIGMLTGTGKGVTFVGLTLDNQR
jgi:hypothetical protein